MSTVVHRLTVSLPDSAADALSRTGNVSQYITRAIERRWVQWQQALGYLMAKGWPSDRIVRAVRSLNGVHQVERGVFEVAAAMLQGGNPGISEMETAACVTLAEEWWMGNHEIRRILLTPETPPSFGMPHQRKRGRPTHPNAQLPALPMHKQAAS